MNKGRQIYRRLTVETLYKSNTFTIMINTRANGTSYYSLMHGLNCDHPIVYSNGSIAYDRPELLPKYVKKTAGRVLFEHWGKNKMETNK
ncbi:hypothetical protein LCGC14_2769580 [marine sediment metagenome]|uniref:Uncharacterized protein n=1 Tax=marine sediment metagenome TaxID=412755 RepID=A0A0F8ZID2_9ZZZZ